jgi:hypothetical protein
MSAVLDNLVFWAHVGSWDTARGRKAYYVQCSIVDAMQHCGIEAEAA